MNKSLFSSASFEWETPKWLFDALHRRFCFTLDVCARRQNTKCVRFFSPVQDGLSRHWHGERCWMNPPYGREIVHWVAKAQREADRGALVVGLLPARTDTHWWHNHVHGHADVRYLSGRLKFGNAQNSAPFPSAIAIWWGWPVLAGRFIDA
jgi:site-specific DNA-methyltransferase (adenine-specific)